MNIPSYNNDGILPPFRGAEPGAPASLMSPYRVTSLEVVDRFATDSRRNFILKGWLDHRIALRSIGLTQGFQWLDGSFVENKDPNDVDVVHFFRRPTGYSTAMQIAAYRLQNSALFSRGPVKTVYHVDLMPIDLDANIENIVSGTGYYLQLFSHQRVTFLWKGMLQVEHNSVQDDQDALALLAVRAQSQQLGTET